VHGDVGSTAGAHHLAANAQAFVLDVGAHGVTARG
jgi:hypothetical protein